MPTAVGTIASHRTASAPTTPPTGMSVWYDASDTATITHAGGAVSQWNDKSANGWHASQVTSEARKPLTGTYTINGRNVIRFSGADQWLWSLDQIARQLVSPTTGEWSKFMVVRLTNIAGIRAPFGQDGAVRVGQFVRFDNGSPLAVAFNTAAGVNTDAPGGTITADTAHCVSGVYTTTTLEVWLNGASNGPSGTSGTYQTAAANFYIGHEGQGSLIAGDIAEIVFYPRAVTVADRQQAEAYLKAKWGTP